MRCLWIAVFFILTPQWSFSKDATLISGLGAGTCAQFAQDYRKTPDAAETIYFNWAQGFMTGRNTALAMAKQTTHDLNSIRIIDQKASIRSYCDAHPLNFFFIAVLDLFESLPIVPASKLSN
jgi:hypothetical protein